MARSREARLIARRGETVVLSREGVPDVIVKAKVKEVGSDRLNGQVSQRIFNIIIAAETLAATGFPVPVVENDRIIIAPTITGSSWSGGTALSVVRPGYRGAGIGWWIEAKG